MLLAKSLHASVRRRRAAALAHRARRRLAIESLETRVALAVSMTIDPTALGLGPKYGVWVSGSANADSSDASKPFKWLDATSRQFVAPPSPTAGSKLPLLSIPSPTVITFDGSHDLSGRLTIFVGAIASPPTAPQLTGTAPAWGVKNVPAAPYLTNQTIADYGTITPYDIVEFTYQHASDANSTFNLSQVDGVGLPLTLSSTATGTAVGLQTGAGFSRAAIGDAFTKFVTADPQGTNFTRLKYGPVAIQPFIQPPTVPANQFFSIANPWYWLKNQNNESSATPAPLLSYWDTTLTKFFTVGNTLSINLSGSDAPDIWEGACANVGGVPTYTLTNVAGSSTTDSGKTFQFAKPAAGYESAKYVFGNKFPASVSSDGDSGLIQDSIWEALNRGVALDGVANAQNPAATAKTIAAPSKSGAVMSGSGLSAWTVTITTKNRHGLQAGDVVYVKNVAGSGNTWFPRGYNGVYKVKTATANTFTYFIPPQGSGTPQALAASGGGTARRVGQTTQAWNGTTQWYQPHASAAFPQFTAAYNTYAKFLHYSTAQGTDSRSGGTPLFINNQAYGFGEDENPDGPYDGGEVPPKFDTTITQGSSLTLRIDPWGSSSSTSLAVVAGDFDGNGLTDVADLKSSGQWQVALTPVSGAPTTVNAASPWSTAPTWSDFTVIRDATTSRDVVIARASDTVDGSWWKLALDGGTWSTTFVGAWGVPDQWVDIVSGDFDGNGRQDIAGRWWENGEWWMLSDAAAAATTANYAAKNVQIGQWNPAASWSQVLAGNFTGDVGGKDTIAGLDGSNWWLLERTGGSSTNTLMASGWSTAHAWADYQVGNFTGAAAGQEQIAARSASTGAWYLFGKGVAITSMASWNPAANWLNVVSGDFDGDGNADIAGRNAVTGTWTVLRKSGGGFANADFGGAWPTSSAWAQAFAGIYNQQSGSPKKAGILGFALSGTGNTWWKAISNGTAFTSSAAPGYPS